MSRLVHLGDGTCIVQPSPPVEGRVLGPAPLNLVSGDEVSDDDTRAFTRDRTLEFSARGVVEDPAGGSRLYLCATGRTQQEALARLHEQVGAVLRFVNAVVKDAAVRAKLP